MTGMRTLSRNATRAVACRGVWLWLIAFGLMLAGAVPPTVAQEQVRTRGWSHPEYGRIVFDWQSRVGYTATAENGEAVVTFDAPLQTTLTEAIANLSDYVQSGTVSDDGRTVRFVMKEPSLVSSFTNETSIVVDITPSPDAEPATAAVEETAPAPAVDAPPLGVRVGQHPTYTRVVFDWTEPVDYSVSEANGIATIRFQKPAAIDPVPVGQALPQGFGRPTSTNTASATVFTLPLPPNRTTKSFLSGTKVVVDVVEGQPPQTAASEETAVPEPAAEEPAEPEPAAENVAVAEQTEDETTEPAAEAEPAPLEDDEVALPGPVALTPQDDQVAASDAEPAVTDDETAAAGDDEVLPETGEEPQSDQEATEDEPAVDPLSEEEQKAIAEAEEAGTVQFLRDSTGQRTEPEGPAPVSFSFDWPEEVGAAAFKRGDYVWVVFDRRAPIDLTPLRQQGAPLVDRIEQLPLSGTTVLRMRVADSVYPSMKLEGFTWVVDFRQQRVKPRQQVEIIAEANADTGPRLIFPVTAPGGVFSIPDPDIGDELRVATVRDPGVGNDGDRRYPEFRILDSAQGVAVERLGDNVLFERSFNGFALSSPDGLHISAVSPEAPVSSGQTYSEKRLFNFAEWKHGGPDEFGQEEEKLMLAVTEVPEDKQIDAWLDLAQFYVAHDMGAEAVGILKIVEGADAKLLQRPEVRALRGAASFLIRDFEVAREDFADPRLDGFAEAALWRAAVLAETNEWRDAAETFKAGDSILRNYPFPLKGELALLRVEAALAIRDPRAAKGWLDDLDIDYEQLRRGEQGDLRYHQGRIAMARNDLDLARELWGGLTRSNDLKNKARAEFSLINLDRQQGTISDAEVVDRLEKLRYQWRGDRFELAVLRRLGEVYIDSDDYFSGLQIWRTAVTYFSKDPLAEELAQQMTDLFRRLYIEGEADRMPPLRALALYDEFRELTPAGAEGDLMIEKLADRLVKVDLLGRAASLLDHQVKFRLQGEERARVGAKLAFIHLLDNDPVGAKEALARTNFPQLERELEDDRRRLRAKAEHELNNDAEAIKLLAGDVSDEADSLRQTIYRDAENWTEAAKVLQRLSGDPPGLNGEIPEDRARHVVNWAVALKLDGDDVGLAQVRSLYGPAMNLSAFRDVFNYIVAPNDEGGASLEASLRQLASGGGFNAFMENYRAKLLSPVLGSDREPNVTTGASNNQQG
ncbi:MAG: hypothetical protein RIM72_19340 [Alphaproteobacteria bacterium]